MEGKYIYEYSLETNLKVMMESKSAANCEGRFERYRIIGTFQKIIALR
jgi:hypothetical protein